MCHTIIVLKHFFGDNICTFTIMHQNIQGLLNKVEILELCIDEFNDNNKYVDIVCLTETFIKYGSEQNIRLKGFNLATSFCRKDKKRGGTCILVRSSIRYNEINNLDLSCEKIFECCGIDLPDHKCSIICLYRIPVMSNINTFMYKLDLLLHKLSSKNRKLIITGDLNINILKQDKNSNDLNNLFLNYNIKSHINLPTRLGSCIDHIASNFSNAKGSVHKVYLSDHDTCQILEVTMHSKKPDIPFWYIYKRDYSRTNISKFLECLSSIGWLESYIEPDVDKAFQIFHDLFCMFYNLCFPNYKVKINANNIKPKWITKGLKK